MIDQNAASSFCSAMAAVHQPNAALVFDGGLA